MKKSPAVFLDRDGVINHNIYYKDTDEWEAPRVPSDLVLIDKSLDGMKKLQKEGFLLFIVSNQSSYAKGKTTLQNLKAIHLQLMTLIVEEKISITDTFYCYHHPKGAVPSLSHFCKCRKPSPYFLFLAEKLYPIDLKHSYMIGDRDTDLLCAKQAGVCPIGIQPDHPLTKKNQKTSQSSIKDLLLASIHISYLKNACVKKSN